MIAVVDSTFAAISTLTVILGLHYSKARHHQ